MGLFKAKKYDIITIDGLDYKTNIRLKNIYAFDNHNMRLGRVAQLKDRQKVELIKNYGEYSKIKYKNKIWYLSNWFIKEFKQEKILNVE